VASDCNNWGRPVGLAAVSACSSSCHRHHSKRRASNSMAGKSRLCYLSIDIPPFFQRGGGCKDAYIVLAVL
jgi:hypothetical protein